MADKEVPLSIVLRTVDKATAGINAVNKRLDAITKPARDLGKAFKDLGEKSGFNAVVDGFKGVGSAISGLLSKVAVVGGLAALAAHQVFAMVDEFDNLGDTAEKLDVTVDFLSAMRFAAERSGASVEQLDQGLTAFGSSMGQLRAGGGRMLKFLQSISPALVTQLKATKGNEAAFRLLSDAMEQITDPQKRLALATKTVGDTALAPMLARGSKGLLALQGEFAGLAGSMEDATAGAGATDDALKNLKAATTGVKAAIVTGLAPALTVLVDKLGQWFVDHREDVKRWAADIGEKLPGAVSRVVESVEKAIGFATKFVDRIGGVKVALVALGAWVSGPLIVAFAQLSAAMLATPFGALLASLGAVLALSIAVNRELARFADTLDTSHEKSLADAAIRPGETAAEAHARFSTSNPVAAKMGVDLERKMRDLMAPPLLGPPLDVRPFSVGAQPWTPVMAEPPAAGSAAPAAAPVKAELKVTFENMPRGARITAKPSSNTDVDVTTGHQMGGGL